MEKNKKTFLIAIVLVFVVMGLVVAKKKKNIEQLTRATVQPKASVVELKALERKGQGHLQETRTFKWSEAKPDVKVASPALPDQRQSGTSSTEVPKRYIDPDIKKKIISQRKVFE